MRVRKGKRNQLKEGEKMIQGVARKKLVGTTAPSEEKKSTEEEGKEQC